jgi:OOP family OmpA-OmpF porin
MKISSCIKRCLVLVAVSLVGFVTGCANYEVNSNRGNIPGYYIRKEMQEADRAVEAARQAGKDKTCPVEFKAAEDAKNNAYDVFRACHTEEGAALAREATAKANALCPPQIPPTANIVITPESITKGASAKMVWASMNAEECSIMPEVGKVQLRGSMTITPSVTTAYTIVCTGAGGNVISSAKIAVVQASPPTAKICAPTKINVQFDTNKSEIKPKYHDELKKLADFFKKFPKATGVIEGHTDSDGSKESNMKLSQRRADSVRKYLIKNFGIAPDRLGAIGYGPTKPVADNVTSAGKQKNRRIEAVFTCHDN